MDGGISLGEDAAQDGGCMNGEEHELLAAMLDRPQAEG
jgi:hypothetical protein